MTSCCSRRATRSSRTGRSSSGTDLRLDESILTGEAKRGRPRGRRRGPVGLVRRRGNGIVRGRRGRRRQLRGAHRGNGARVPPSTLAARTGDRPAALRAARRDGAARGDADRRALEAGRRCRPRGRDRGRRDGDPDSRGPRCCSSRSRTRRRRCGWHAPALSRSS